MHLSRTDSDSVCVVGAGAQARMQLEAVCLVRDIRQATVWARDGAKAEITASELSEQLEIEVRVSKDLATAVSAADIVITTTPSFTPLVRAEWLRPGQHVTAMGSDAQHKNELESACIVRADRYVPDRLSQTRQLGELHHAIEAGLVSIDSDFAELGDIVSGMSSGRVKSDEITICDLTGTGLQDTAIATFARQRANEIGAGTSFQS